MKLHETGMC